jgi:hypothetical protein
MEADAKNYAERHGGVDDIAQGRGPILTAETASRLVRRYSDEGDESRLLSKPTVDRGRGFARSAIGLSQQPRDTNNRGRRTGRPKGYTVTNLTRLKLSAKARAAHAARRAAGGTILGQWSSGEPADRYGTK